MPAYITTPQAAQVSALYKGDTLTLINQAGTVDPTNITKTLQFAVGPEPGMASRTFSFVNSTNQTATVAVAPSEVLFGGSGSSTYEPTSTTVAAGATGLITLSGGWVCCTFQTAPSSGSLIATS